MCPEGLSRTNLQPDLNPGINKPSPDFSPKLWPPRQKTCFRFSVKTWSLPHSAFFLRQESKLPFPYFGCQQSFVTNSLIASFICFYGRIWSIARILPLILSAEPLPAKHPTQEKAPSLFSAWRELDAKEQFDRSDHSNNPCIFDGLCLLFQGITLDEKFPSFRIVSAFFSRTSAFHWPTQQIIFRSPLQCLLYEFTSFRNPGSCLPALPNWWILRKNILQGFKTLLTSNHPLVRRFGL